jgi:hypothetical protein
MGIRDGRAWGDSPIGANGGICCRQRINKKAPALSPGAFTQSPPLYHTLRIVKDPAINSPVHVRHMTEYESTLDIIRILFNNIKLHLDKQKLT